MQDNIFPIKHTLLQQSDKEILSGHKGIVLWMFGLSGSGKTTIARALENELYSRGIHTKLLDGDNLRAGIRYFSAKSDANFLKRRGISCFLFLNGGMLISTVLNL